MRLALLSAIALLPVLALAQEDKPEEPPAPIPMSDDVKQAEVNTIVDEVQSLTPEQIQLALMLYKRNASATNNRYPNAKRLITTSHISNSPGEVQPKLHLGIGLPSAVAFTDSTGTPWPVDKVLVDTSVVEWEKLRPHLVSLTALSVSPHTNILVILKDSQEAFSINIMPVKDEIDSYKTFQVITGMAPSTTKRVEMQRAAAQSNTPTTAKSQAYEKFLRRDIPDSAVSVPLRNAPENEVFAWQFDNKLIVLSQLRMLSPQVEPALHGANGWRVYALKQPDSVMLFLQNNSATTVTFSEMTASAIRNAQRMSP
ncbi:DotH/IcmK family type IV secretion protein [Idiomarina abyssalis]|uniref:Uncharacterized protein n=1 Tax=Idiomarina abyssalis TaxID=86102 RepID=A0A8I1KIC3_9GAMM|nr:DotH/IcmK family type IV secretion protein [Idiomarina abyssalis]MBJ7265571.1 hypothetical protein [Idiomarina abyssalis]MBJ7316755.1 hypothetical protein [Idiomarina abyssalis]